MYQGRVEPVPAFVKKGKQGIGAKGAKGLAVGAPAKQKSAQDVSTVPVSSSGPCCMVPNQQRVQHLVP